MTTPDLATTRFETAAGSAPRSPVSLIVGPALGTSAETAWGPAGALLSKHHDTLAWDLPGHGRSRPASAPFTVADLADAVVHLADDAGLERFAYAGVSIGGAVGLELAVRHPERLVSLTAICTLGQFGTPEGWRDRARQVRSEGLVIAPDAATRMFAPGFADAHPARAEQLLQAMARVDATSYAFCCEALAGYDVREQLGTVTAPTLVIAAEHDRVCSMEDAETLALTVQRGRAEALPGAAHYAPPEQPERVAVLIAESIAEHA